MEWLERFEVIVIGAGHAGIEAAVASARRGCKTGMMTISLDQIGNMPCNPSIGGSAKGHLVREIDALGGVMGIAADKCCLQMRMLNLSKGASVHSPRAQEDRMAYHQCVKSLCENTKNLQIIQSEAADILFDEQGHVCGVKNIFGGVYACRAVVLCAGTYLKGRVYIGKSCRESGPDSCLPANTLSERLSNAGIAFRRFKTGTPARVHRRSICFSELTEQRGDKDPVPFSFTHEIGSVRNDARCYIAWTNAETHRVIRENIQESPLYSGMIDGIGPRYCPSIEDKVIRFAGRERHQIFVEPTGVNSEEMYLQGLSTSLPENVQRKMLRTIAGFEHIEIMRSAYAIEYDCINPIHLLHTLEFRDFPGLYAAGQINGTSGYEEAAAQGLLAGINASAAVRGEEELVLPRSSSYIGTLVDDLVTKGTDDPYRMMTARSEYRLSLRQGNADARLTPIGRKYGLIDDERWNAFQTKMKNIENACETIAKTTVHPTETVNSYLKSVGTSEMTQAAKLDSVLCRPQVKLREMMAVLNLNLNLNAVEEEETALRIKYERYVERENEQNAHLKHLEKVKLSQNIDYSAIYGLSSEAVEKLSRVKPETLAQAARISGVSPADVSILLTWRKAGNPHE